jgi:hypothetical protein
MSDPLEHAKLWAEAIDSSRTRREPSGAETVFPVCAAAMAFFLFFVAHAVIVAQPYTFSVVEWLIAIPAYSGVAIVAAVWPDSGPLAVCASIVWAFVSTSLLFLFALAGTDGHSDWKVVFPWPLVAIPLVVASLAGYLGAQVGEFLKERSRRRRSRVV